MSLRNGNRRKKVGKKGEIKLDLILRFVKFIQSMACGMLVMAIIGLLLLKDNIGSTVVYCMVIVVNLIIVFCGMIPIKFIEKKVNL